MLAYQYNPNDRHTSDLFAANVKVRLAPSCPMVPDWRGFTDEGLQSVLEQVHEGVDDDRTSGHRRCAGRRGRVPHAGREFADAVSATSKYYIPTPSPTTHEVLAAVAAAGGVVIIAHPGAVNRNVTLLSDSQIETLIEEGLDGLEVWHRDNPPQQRERLYAIAQAHQLLVTGGSDWHGAGKPNHLGENLTDDETVAEIVRRGAISLV